ncbi:hypothetical protein FUAX_34870 [Fulvitalea axinellae]|uniref:Phage shock protein PspC N-terminal domain-containing protein n=1 Tax=Fulvitalea axinellae TaxID=1182444 RepID=A0AAU9DEX0_9BACT|nr:hypothetical protein FUAX_34870 [Fulvitalea axinellae]
MKNIRKFIDHQAFGVCAKLAEKFQLPIYKIRLWFIYSSFFTLGSSFLVYISLAFVVEIRKALRQRYNQFWYN